MIRLLKEKATSIQIQEMLERYENMIKIVVDVRRRSWNIGSNQYGKVH